MQLHSIELTPAAIDDIQAAMEFYNTRSPNLGFRFTDEVQNSLMVIAKMPNAYGIRYKNVRAKLLHKFPFLIYFIVNENECTVKVLRVFNTNLDPKRLKNNP